MSARAGALRAGASQVRTAVGLLLAGALVATLFWLRDGAPGPVRSGAFSKDVAFDVNAAPPACRPGSYALLAHFARATRTATAVDPSAPPPRVLFVVLTSTATRERAAALRSSWLRWVVRRDAPAVPVPHAAPLQWLLAADCRSFGAPAACGSGAVLVSDAADVATGATMAPGAAGRPSYSDAQTRQFATLAALARVGALAQWDWVALVDDDTWVNVPALLDTLSQLRPDVSAVLGYVWDGMRWNSNMAALAGGAGMLLSAAAAATLASRLPTAATDPAADLAPGACAFCGYNDVSLSACAWHSGVPVVHVSALRPHAPPWEDVIRDDAVRVFPWSPADAVSTLSFHYATADDTARLDGLAAQVWEAPQLE
jgi:hypothetical protein